jgi:hypothetical protein
MSNENHNNPEDWRSKLGALHNLPGETVIDENASWEKLHDRLRKKKSSKKIIGYWLAAACLLLVLMIPLLHSIQKDQVLAKTETLHQQPRIIAPATILIDKKDPVKITTPAPVEKNQIRTVADKGIEKYQVVVPSAITKENRVSDAVSNTDLMKETTIPSFQPLDTSLNITAALPAVKKLKVVHINELGDPVAEAPGIARSYEHRSLPVRLINQEVYTAPPSLGNTGFNIFKTKPTPSN